MIDYELIKILKSKILEYYNRKKWDMGWYLLNRIC